MSTDEIQKLDRCLISGHPILFTGAGFSMGATNENGDEIPSANLLKKQIIEDFLGLNESLEDYKELVNSSLAAVYTYACNTVSNLRLRDFITERLSGFHPQSYHEILLGFNNWLKIYTVNIDDVVENSQCGNRFIIQNSYRKISYTKANKTEYIKLHGCVRNKDGKIVFSNTQYVDSMLNSTDYRFSCFAQDMQIEDFVIVGTEMNEINLDYYIELFSSATGKTGRGQLFFINPKPSIFLKGKIQNLGAIIIPWTTQQFAEHISTLNQPNNILASNLFIKDFLNIREVFNKERIISNYKSKLYFGDYPNYKDMLFDWDFINPDIEDIINNTKNIKGLLSYRRMVAFYGKAMSGKSLYLKRIAVSFVRENFAVYQFCGKDFDIHYFAKRIKSLPEPNVALIIDDASFYYREIASLIRIFPKEKNLIVFTAARTYQHFRKRYCLVSESWFDEQCITGETSNNVFAANIAERLDEKGLLGKLKFGSKKPDERKDFRIAKIKNYNDVSSFLYAVNSGRYYQERMRDYYFRLSENFVLEHDFLIQLSIFYKLNLPFFPSEVFGLIYGENSKHVLNNVDNFITYFPDHNSYAIRSYFLVPYVLRNVSHEKLVSLVAEILMYVSPQVVDGYHSYWNEIASTLMKCKLLRRQLNLRNLMVKKLLSSIKNYYNDDYNYWLQVGLSEQYDNEFDLALNHFEQAESISPNSYLVKNAIARNFLRQANVIDNKEKANLLFDEGVKLMEKLIREREENQVRAYSTHCLLFEKIRFFRKYNIIPDEETLQNMYKSLKSISEKNPNDPMSSHISNIFLKFVNDNKLNGKLPKMNLQDLGMFKVMIQGSDMLEKDLLENFELDE